jgi:hypothetical protein
MRGARSDRPRHCLQPLTRKLARIDRYDGISGDELGGSSSSSRGRVRGGRPTPPTRARAGGGRRAGWNARSGRCAEAGRGRSGRVDVGARRGIGSLPRRTSAGCRCAGRPVVEWGARLRRRSTQARARASQMAMRGPTKLGDPRRGAVAIRRPVGRHRRRGTVLAPQSEERATGVRSGCLRPDPSAVVPAIRRAAQQAGPLDETEVAAFAARDLARGQPCREPVSGVVRGIDMRGSLLVDVGSETVAVRTGSLILTEGQ